MVLALSNYVLMPGLCKEVFDVGNAGVGILLGVAAAGGFVMSLVVASLADRSARRCTSRCPAWPPPSA